MNRAPAKEFDEDFAIQVCTYCPSLCRFECPVEEVAGKEAASPRFQVALEHHLRQGVIPRDLAASDAVTFCSGCGACQAICEHDNPVAQLLQRARTRFASKGLVPERYRPILEHLEAGRSPEGALLSVPPEPSTSTSAKTRVLRPSDRALGRGIPRARRAEGFLEALGEAFRATSVPGAVSPRWAKILGAKKLGILHGRLFKKSISGAKQVFFEDPYESLTKLPRGITGKTYWDYLPEGGWTSPDPGLGLWLAPKNLFPGFERLGRTLGLKDGSENVSAFLGLPGQDLFDLTHPELARGMAERISRVLRGAPVLVPSPTDASVLEEFGVTAWSPADLRPRESP